MQQIQATRGAFAAILGDGSVVTWGDVCQGGESRDVQDQLRDVKQIQATESAFAAILGDGSVVTWGLEDHRRRARERIPENAAVTEPVADSHLAGDYSW